MLVKSALFIACSLFSQHRRKSEDESKCPALLPGNSDPQHKSDPSPAVDILMERFTRFYKEVTPPAGPWLQRWASVTAVNCHCRSRERGVLQ